METEILRELSKRTIKNFLDVLVLAELNNGQTMSGYDVIALIHKKFHLLMSSGTVYNVLYALERKELIEGMWSRKKRVYKLRDKGEETIKTTQKVYEKIQILVARLFGAQEI